MQAMISQIPMLVAVLGSISAISILALVMFLVDRRDHSGKGDHDDKI